MFATCPLGSLVQRSEVASTFPHLSPCLASLAQNEPILFLTLLGGPPLASSLRVGKSGWSSALSYNWNPAAVCWGGPNTGLGLGPSGQITIPEIKGPVLSRGC